MCFKILWTNIFLFPRKTSSLKLKSMQLYPGFTLNIPSVSWTCHLSYLKTVRKVNPFTFEKALGHNWNCNCNSGKLTCQKPHNINSTGKKRWQGSLFFLLVEFYELCQAKKISLFLRKEPASRLQV